MKLSNAQQLKVEAQLGVPAVPDDHPATPELEKAFGSHTFFLVTDGLHVIEPMPEPESPSGNVVRVASWANEERTELLGHAPEVLEVTVDLVEDEGSDPAA